MLPKLDTLDVSSSIGCNLECKGCNHFSNYFSAGSKINTDSLLDDIKVILPRVDVERVNVIGGEPLLNPRCEEILKTCIEYAPKRVNMYTNGELILENQWIRDYLELPNVYLRISLHLPESTERGRKIIENVKQFDHPKLIITEHHTGADRWFDSIKKRGDKVHPYNQGNIQKSFKWCSCPNAQLYNGMLWKCPNTAFLREMLYVMDQTGDPEWDPYLVDGVPVSCSDEELEKFCKNSFKAEPVCNMCTHKPLHFSAAQQQKTKRKVIITS